MKCSQCGREMNEHIETIWQHASGWVKRRDAGGTNHLALRELHDLFVCNGCMVKLQSGISVHQGTLR